MNQKGAHPEQDEEISVPIVMTVRGTMNTGSTKKFVYSRTSNIPRAIYVHAYVSEYVFLLVYTYLSIYLSIHINIIYI